jgi:acetyl-CoA acetyltransferase
MVATSRANASVCVVGAAAIPCGRHMSTREAPLQALEHEALAGCVIAAMRDAGLPKESVGALVFSLPRPYTEQRYFGTFMANYLRLAAKGVLLEVLGNGMTGGLAFDQAAQAIASGRADVALALGVNFETAVPSAEHMTLSMRAVGDVDFQVPFGFTPISWYAMDAVRYMHEHGATREQLAMVAVKSRRHAALNPLAQYRKPVTLEEVLAQRPIVEPLGLFEVPPMSDGAACVVLAREEVAKGLGERYLKLRGRGFYHEGAHQISEIPNDMIAFDSAARAARAAYAEAGIGAQDVDLAELYAPCTIVEVLAAEAIGLVPRGQGARAAAEGVTALGGRIPVNTSGGLIARGHPPYVTPLYSYVELAEQLRHRAGERQVDAAEIGVVSAELGNYNAALIHVLEGQA